MFSLRGKTAIFTGATGGLGSSIALALARAGASIISIELPNDPNSAALSKSITEVSGPGVQVFQSDLSDVKSIRACFASIWEAGIVPDILVNSAGIIRRNTCENMTDEDLNLILDINLKSVYVSCQEFGRRLLALNRGGKIINLASVTAFQANQNTSAYSTSKGGIIQMTKAFSNEWASKNIQVNCISPGFMRTAMTDIYANDPSITQYLMSRVPAARWGVPQDLDAAALFLVAPSNTFTTGVSVTVDGGFCGK